MGRLLSGIYDTYCPDSLEYALAGSRSSRRTPPHCVLAKQAAQAGSRPQGFGWWGVEQEAPRQKRGCGKAPGTIPRVNNVMIGTQTPPEMHDAIQPQAGVEGSVGDALASNR